MMRKYIIALVAVFSVLCAEAGEKKFLSWGVEAGANFNSLSFNSDMFSSSNRTGFFVGPKARLNLPLLSFSADAAVLYSMKGASVNNISKNLSYLEIPINLRYDFSFGFFGLYLATGPQYNLCLSSGDVIPNMSMGNRSTWSWNAGGGIVLFKHLNIGACYAIPITSGSWYPKFGDVVDAKNQNVQLRLTYMF